MKIITLALLLIFTIVPAHARGGHSIRGSRSYSAGSRSNSVSVRSYTKKDGTFVQSHHRTNPNQTQNDNWSTKGNVNPYTGKEGTKEPTK